MNTILYSGEKQFIFEFAFSSQNPAQNIPQNLTPGEMEEDNTEDTDVDTQVSTYIGKAASAYLDLTVYREDCPDLKFKWSGFLLQNKRIPLQVPTPPPLVFPPDPKKTTPGKKTTPAQMEPDQNWCKGEFYLYHNSITGQRYVWFDLQFGENYEAVYEGCMIQFPIAT